MEALLDSLLQVVFALWSLLLTLFDLVLPWTPLIAWIAFWLLAVNWESLRQVLVKGGWIGVVLIGLVMILVWGVIAPPEAGKHAIAGLQLSNFVGKTVYVTVLFCIALLCGAVQLSGVADRYLLFPSPEEEAEPVAHHHHADAHAHH